MPVVVHLPAAPGGDGTLSDDLDLVPSQGLSYTAPRGPQLCIDRNRYGR